MGCGIFATYPQIAAYGGLHALLIYAVSGGLPFLLFASLGPIIRRRCPEGFILTEWVRRRYGVTTSIVLSCCTILSIFLYMVSELSAVRLAVESLTTVPGLPVLIVEAIIVSIYTSAGGFSVSFVTDNIQAVAAVILLVVCGIAIGVTVKIDKSEVGPSDLLKADLLGWKLMYILPVAIVCNDCFMAGFWLRTFASRTDKDLFLGCFLGGFSLFVICALVGIPGLLAVWAHLLDQNSPTFSEDAANGFYLVLLRLPKWIAGFVLVFIITLSTCTFDSLQSALASTVSNDFFRNRLRMVWIRVFVLLTMVPCIVVALKGLNILNIYLIVDVLAAAVIPVLFLGLSSRFFFLTGFEVICSMLGGIWAVFIFGCIYYGNVQEGGSLLVMSMGLYVNDWGPFGAFVAAPLGCLVGGLIGLLLRGVFLWCKTRHIFAVFVRDKEGKEPRDTMILRAWIRRRQPWYEVIHMPVVGRKIDRALFISEDEIVEREIDKDEIWQTDNVESEWKLPQVRRDIKDASHENITNFLNSGSYRSES